MANNLEVSAVEKANAEFYANHPERNGRPISSSEPEYAELSAEWKSYYKKHASLEKPAGASSTKNTTSINNPEAQTCPLLVPEVCVVKDLTVKCKHRKAIKLSDIEASPNVAYEVVAGWSQNDDEITVEAIMKKEPCGQHSSILVSSDLNQILEIGGKTHKFKANSASFDHVSKWDRLWLTSVKPSKGAVTVNSCSTLLGTSTVDVWAWPDLEWDIGVTVGKKQTYGRSISRTRRNVKEKIQDENNFSLVGHVKHKANGKEHELKLEFEKYTGRALDALDKFNKVSEYALKYLNTNKLKIDITEPNLGFTYISALKEDKDKCHVNRTLEFSFDANPLLGIVGTVDCLDWLIDLAGKSAAAHTGGASILIADRLKALREKLQTGNDGLKAGIGIDIIADGQINGKMSLKFEDIAAQSGTGFKEFTGGISPVLKLSLKGYAEITIDAWVIEFKAGASFEGTTGIGGNLFGGCDDDGIFIEGNLYFAGLKFVREVYISAASEVKSKSPFQKSKASSEVKQSVDVCELIPAWPDPSALWKAYIIKNE